jgi:hypothetical protein
MKVQVTAHILWCFSFEVLKIQNVDVFLQKLIPVIDL